MTTHKRKKGSKPETPMFRFPTPDWKGGETRDTWRARAEADFARKADAYVADVRAWKLASTPTAAAAEGDYEPGGGSGGGGGASGGW